MSSLQTKSGRAPCPSWSAGVPPEAPVPYPWAPHPQSGCDYEWLPPTHSLANVEQLCHRKSPPAQPRCRGMSLVNVNRLLTFIFFSLCKIPIINSDLRDQTVNNVLILACFQVMYCTVLETYGRLLLFLTNTSQSTREGRTASRGRKQLTAPHRGV